MDLLPVDLLEAHDQHRAVRLLEDRRADLDDVVGPDGEEAAIERGVMEFAQRDAVADDRLALGVAVGRDVGGVEEVLMCAAEGEWQSTANFDNVSRSMPIMTADRPTETRTMRLPQRPPSLEELLQGSDASVIPRIIAAGVNSATIAGDYLHWDQLRHRAPPEGLDLPTWWLGLKLARGALSRAVSLRATDGRLFRYSLPDEVLELLHWIDQHAAGEIVVSETIRDEGDRRRYLVNSLFEEAITSSQLEGASSTRQVAKEMLRTGRPPRDRSERMILNNYRAMSMLRTMVGRPLATDDVLTIHRVVTGDTLDDPSASGRLQTPTDQRVVVESGDGTIVHVPPPADELPERLAAMCAFANGESDEGFVHPVIRAILLHLWLAYDHPFEDGNGRTARALFYRTMLSQGYWLFEYVTISRLLVKAPAQYANAFLYVETDDWDATYFLIHQLQVIKRAIEELLAYIKRKMSELRQTIRLLRQTDLNHRQIALLTHALRHADAEYTIQSHATSHRVVRQSARTDLHDLEARGLLSRRRVGRKFFYAPAPDLRTRLEGAQDTLE